MKSTVFMNTVKIGVKAITTGERGSNIQERLFEYSSVCVGEASNQRENDEGLQNFWDDDCDVRSQRAARRSLRLLKSPPQLLPGWR